MGLVKGHGFCVEGIYGCLRGGRREVRVSNDVVAVLRAAPDEEAIGYALLAAGPDLWLVSFGDGGGLQLWEEEGKRLVVTMEAPVHVRTAGEVERLLGFEMEPPVWWVDVYGAEDVKGSDVVAVRLAAELALRCDGTVWADHPDYAHRAGLRGR